MDTQTFSVIIVIQYVIIPLLLGVYFLVRRARDRWTILFRILFISTALPVFFYVPPWAMFWYPLRYLVLSLFTVALLWQFRYWNRTGWHAPGIVHWFGKGTLIGFSILFGLITLDVFLAFKYSSCVNVEAPLRNGTYVVLQGGSTLILNRHNEVLQQRYALDIVKMVGGRRAKGIFPSNNENFYIWQDSIYSICSGIVVRAIDSLPDGKPSIFRQDTLNPAGNFVIVKCNEDFEVLYAHIKSNTVAVKTGDTVSSNTFLGLVGNSGNSTEPHLHIHAYKNNQPVQLCIHNEWLVRNSTFSHE